MSWRVVEDSEAAYQRLLRKMYIAEGRDALEQKRFIWPLEYECGYEMPKVLYRGPCAYGVQIGEGCYWKGLHR